MMRANALKRAPETEAAGVAPGPDDVMRTFSVFPAE